VEPIFGSFDRSTTCIDHEVLQNNYPALPHVLDSSNPSVNASVDPGLGQSSPVFRNIEPNRYSKTMLSISNPAVFISIEQELSTPDSSFEIDSGFTQSYYTELPIKSHSISTRSTWTSLEPDKKSLESATIIGNAVGRTINTEYRAKLEILRTVLVSFNPEPLQLSTVFCNLEAKDLNNPQLDISPAFPLISVWPDSGPPDLHSGFLNAQKDLPSP